LVQANLDDERGVPASHLSLFDEFAAAVGAPPAADAGPATGALVGCYRRGAADGAVAVLAMIAAYEVQAPGIATSKAEGLRLRYGLDTTQTRFWDVHGRMDADHGDWTLDALAAVADDEPTVRAAAGAAADAWWAFLDERQEAAGLPAAC
ncbi:MAG: iron-containing redox enzyme family protein, partial [Gemmatimonadales bacterium]